MIDDLLTHLRTAAQGISSNVGNSAAEKTDELIGDWLTIFPQLARYGLDITSFTMGVALSPTLKVELVGSHVDWTEERIAEHMANHTDDKALTLVLTTLRTAYRFQKRTGAPLRDPLIVKIAVRLNPEVRVVLGQPVLED